MAEGLYGKLVNGVNKLSGRQASQLLLLTAAAVLTVIYLAGSEISDNLEDNPRLIQARTGDLETLGRTLNRYQTLKTKREAIENSFKESQMTFEQVTDELDKVVKESIGSSEYDLKKIRTPSNIGLSYEKQEFTLNIKSLNLDQLVRLLHRLENGDRPLFLGKVDINKPAGNSAFSATLEVFSVRKAKGQDTA